MSSGNEPNQETPIGVANALTGDETANVKAIIMEQGEGIGNCTCQYKHEVENVVKENPENAYYVAKNIMLEIDPKNRFFSNSILRVRFFGGDGTCAGCTMVTSLLSLALNIPVNKNLAMTGDITLTGEILGVSDVREKILAAKGCQVRMIIFPEANRGEFDMLEASMKEGFDVYFVDSYKQVFELAFGYQVLLSTLQEMIFEETPVGVAMSLATSTLMVGEATYIEATVVEEEGIRNSDVIDLTANEMKHSVLVACLVAANILLEKEPVNRFFFTSKVHLQFLGRPIQRDGASAECTMVTSLLSLAMKRPVRRNLAMTGAVTTTGGILEIDGVREKTIVAKRSQVTMIIFPEANREEFERLEDDVKKGLEARFVDSYGQVYELAFGYDQE